MANIDQKIEDLQKAIKSSLTSLPFADGQNFYKQKKMISEMESKLLALMAEKK